MIIQSNRTGMTCTLYASLMHASIMDSLEKAEVHSIPMDIRECSLFTWGGAGKLEQGRGKLHTPPLRGTKITNLPFFTDKSYYPPPPGSMVSIPVKGARSGAGQWRSKVTHPPLFARKSYIPPSFRAKQKLLAPPPPDSPPPHVNNEHSLRVLLSLHSFLASKFV